MSRRRRAAAEVVSEEEQSEEEVVAPEPEPASAPAPNLVNKEMEMIESASTAAVIEAVNFATESLLKVLDVTRLCYSDDKPGLKRQHEEKMDRAMKKVIRGQMTNSQAGKCLKAVYEELSLKDHDGDEESFFEGVDSLETLTQQSIAEYSESLTEDDIMATPEYIRFRNMMTTQANSPTIENESESEDEETDDEIDLDESVETGSGEVIPELDPISKQPLTDPVRNRVCRHIYGKATMIELLKKNPRTRCPAMGCTNANFVKVADLEEDSMLTAKVNGLHGEALAVAAIPVQTGPSRRRR